jgi:hypothetical protein
LHLELCHRCVHRGPFVRNRPSPSSARTLSPAPGSGCGRRSKLRSLTARTCARQQLPGIVCRGLERTGPDPTDWFRGAPRPRQTAEAQQFDAIDAEAAAGAVQAGTATARPNAGDGPIEMLRMLHAARRSAIKACTQAVNQLHALVGTAPDSLRSRLGAKPATAGGNSECVPSHGCR